MEKLQENSGKLLEDSKSCMKRAAKDSRKSTLGKIQEGKRDDLRKAKRGHGKATTESCRNIVADKSLKFKILKFQCNSIATEAQ